VSIPVLANDLGTALLITAVTEPLNGSARVQGDPVQYVQYVQYVPNAGFTGVDNFTYSVSDGRGGSAMATVTVTVVAPPNAAPVAVPDIATTFETLPVDVFVLANDVDADGDALVISSVSASSNGTVSVIGSGIRYTPNEGFTANDAFSYVIGDGKGGSSTGSVRIRVLADEVPPAISATVAPEPNASGWHKGDVSIAFWCRDDESGLSICPDTVVVTAEGAGQEVSGTASDRAGNTAERRVVVRLDRSSPTLALSAPASARAGERVLIKATASDNLELALVRFLVDSVLIEEREEAPFEASLIVPTGAPEGSLIAVEATATDRAGNSETASLTITVAGGGFVQGETYDDTRGVPLAGVSVFVGSDIRTTDALGRFSTFTPSAAPTVIRFARDGFTPVERFVEVDALRGTLVLDARLTPLDPEGFVTIDGSGGVVAAGAVRLEVPAGAVSSPTSFRLTEVSGQGLRAPLPLGWSPLASVQIEPDLALVVPADLLLEGAGPDSVLIRYDDALHTWVAHSSSIELTGAYAFVVADDGVLAPVEGEALAAAEPVSVSFGLTATATVTPEVSPVSPDARATGSLTVSSIVPLPSGTLVSARVEESYEGFEGEIRPEPFTQELVLYKNGSSLSTEFPVTPTRKFTAEELRQGRVHVDIKTTPARHRGSLVGAGGRLVEGEGGLSLSISAGAVTASIAASLEPLETSDLDFAFPGFPVVDGAEIDLGGATLALPATLSMSASLPSAENLYAARLLFVAGQRKLRLVGPARRVEGALVVSGIETGGSYFVFQSDGPLAFVTGVAREGGLPASLVVVESSTTPFTDVTPSNGRFMVAARLGVESTISGSSLRTGNHGSATVLPPTADPLDIVLDLAASGPYVARVSPADGEKGVSRSAVVTVELSEAVAADGVTASSFRVLRSSDQAPVAGRITLGTGRRSIAFLPDSALEPVTAYTVSLTSDIADSAGNALLPFHSTFTTVAPDSADLDPDAVKVSFPDADGNVTVSAEAGSFEAGASITIVNVTNGVVVSSEVSFDGGFEIALRASFTDELQIRILDAAGREVVIDKTEYRSEDGRVAIGSKGGTVTAGDFVLDVPEGALSTAAIFRLTPLTEDEIANLPIPEGAGGIGSAVRVETGGVILEKEADLSFPIPPEVPADALYLVLRTVEVSGELLYEVVDTASVEDGKVRTNSAPFPGLLYPGDHVLNWYPLSPSLPKTEIGLVVGLAQETGGTAAKATATPLGNVEVRLDKTAARGDYVARSLSNGRFTMVDVGFGFSGTTIALTGKAPDGRSARATAFEGTGVQQGVSPKFNRTGEAVLNFQPNAPEPPPGRVAIRLFKTLGSVRQEIASGFVAVGTDILFTIEFTDAASPPARVVAGIAGTTLAVTTVDEFHYEARFTPSDPRSYTLHVTAFDVNLREIFGDVSFLAVEGSSGNDQVMLGPPSILTAETSPKSGALGIDVHPIFTVKFSEPVTNVTSETVKLQAAGGGTAVPLERIGTGPDFGPAIPGPESKVNSLTLRALEGLRFATRYELVFESGIVDTDPSPNALARTVLDFETLAPAELSNVTAEADPLAMATLGERVFLALQDEKTGGSFGSLVAYDISDPQKPVKLDEAVLSGSGSAPRNSLYVGSMARDIQAEENVDVGIGRRDLVAVLSFNPRSGNSGLTLFDVSLTSPRYPYLGFVTTNLPGQGFASSLDLRGSFAYVAGGSVGLELLDLKKAVELYRAESPSDAYAIPFMVSQSLFSRGVGFGQPAIVRTVPIEVAGKTLSATEVEVAETSQGVVGLVGAFDPLESAGYLAVLSLASLSNPVVEGFVQLLVVLPEDQGVLEVGVPTDVGFAEIGGADLALVVGQGRVPGSDARVGRLAVVDVTDPKNPKLLSVTSLEGSNASGLALSGLDTVLVSTPEGVESYSFLNPSRPRLSGKLPGIAGALGDLSLANENAVLVSVGKNKELKLTALAVVPTLGIVPSPVVTGEETLIPADPAFGHFRKILQPGNFVVGRIPEEFEVTTAEVELLRETSPFATLPASVLPDGQILVRFEPGAALPMPSPRMRAVLNRGTALEKFSAPEPVLFAPLLFGVKELVPIAIELDPVNGTSCLRFADTITYGLNLSAQVTVTTVVGGTERILFDGVREAQPGGESLFEESVDDDVSLFSMVAGKYPYKVRARLLSDPSVSVEQGGEIEVEIATHGVLPVGATFVKGVNLFDGHLVVSSTDARIGGRIPLEIARTYGSGGLFSDESALGVGWSFNYGSTLIATECFVVVVGGDGTGQRFVRSGDRFVAQKGYHGELRLNPDGSYDFFTKGRVRYHFVDTPPTEGAAVFRGLNPTLDFIEDGNGNKLRMLYDGLSRLSKVQEEEASGKAGRGFELHYSPEPIRLKHRIESVTGPMGLVVSYGYDELGNLVRATRGEKTERYEYTIDSLDQYNMTARVDPNGNRTEYVYYEDNESFPGEEPGAPIGMKWEYVKEVREPEGVMTSFEYDFSEMGSFRWIRRVTDGRGFATRYVLNGNGSPLEIEEPGQILTTMVWASNDIHKIQETDAKGRLTRFEYDDRGNLTQEVIVAGGDIGTVATEFRYDRLFNKMTYKKDAEGRETFFEIDQTNGNLLSVKDAEENVTRYHYFPNGDLMRTEGPRTGQTADFQADEFGNPETTTDALGNETTTVYDERSRLRSSSDTMGRRMGQDFDELDRVTQVRRFDDVGSSDEQVVQRTYHPGGEVLTETNGLGLVATYVIDGLNRVIRVEERLSDRALVSSMLYDKNSNLTQKTDRRGVVTINKYDALNRLDKVDVAGQTVSTLEYDEVGNKIAETDIYQSRTVFEPDELYRVKRRILPTGHEERFGYDQVGNKTSETDANGKTTLFKYDFLNRLTKRTDAVGNVAQFDYDGSGNRTLEEDVTRGLVTSTEYDVLNRPEIRTVTGADPDGFVYLTTFDYDDEAHTVIETDPRGFRRTTELDGFDRVHQVSQETGDEVLETTSFYDANGNLKKSLDAEDRETEFIYDEKNRLVEVHHPLGLTSQFSYDGEGNKLDETDRRGLVTRFAYDLLGRLLRREIDQPITGGGALKLSEVSYLDSERKRVAHDARNNATTFEMDQRGRVTKITDPDGFSQTFEYDGVDKIAEVDKKGRRTQFEYDGIHRLTKVTDALLQTLSTTYLDSARQIVEIDKRGINKQTELDALGRLLSVTRSSVILERHEYDANSNRVLSTDANGNRTQFEYEGANRLIARTDALGTLHATTTGFLYDKVGNLLEQKDGRITGRPFDVRNVYDDLNRLETSADGEGNVTTYEYDADGNRTAVIEPKGTAYRTEYDYGELDELLQVRMPDGGVYSYRYEPTRNRIFQQDGEGNVVTFSYDKLNRLDFMTQDPGGFNLTTNHEYDPNGNEIRLTDPKGQIINFDYDELNRLKFKVYNLAAADLALFTRTHRIDYVYNPNDDVERIDETKSSGTDPPAVVSSTKTYDDLDRLETETDAWGRRLTYDYDPAGNRISLIDPDGKRTVYTYDELHRLEILTLDDQQAVNYEYFPDGLKKTVTNPNRTVSNYLYDAADRMTDITHIGPTGVVSSYSYQYDPSGNRELQVETNAGRTETTEYTYDFVNRLKTVTYPDRSVRYEYDLAGNRIQEVTTGAETSDETFHYDAINRLERITDNLGDEDVVYSYDANGNTTSKTKGGITTNFLFDIRDQLGEVRQGSNVLGRYGYDYDGRRILKIGDDGRRQYTYDQLSVITEADQVNATVSKYDYGMDQLVRLDNRNESRSFFHLDGLRSTVSLTDSGGGSRQSIFYDAWGNERDRIGTSANNFTFTGHEFDEETGLIYAKARFYDADVGRFLSQDSLLGTIDAPPSLHRYVYTFSNPTRFIDPHGREPITLGTLALLGLLGAEIGFFTDYTAQAVETSGFLREDFNATRSALVTGGGAVSGVFGGVLTFFGLGTAAATTSAIALDSSLDTGVEAMLVEEGQDFDASLTFTKNVGLNTLFGGLGAAGAKLFHGARSLLTGGDEVLDDFSRTVSDDILPTPTTTTLRTPKDVIDESGPVISVTPNQNLPGRNRGLSFVTEPSGDTGALSPKMKAAHDFDAGTTGAFSDVALRERAVPALRLDNPDGVNFTKFDGFEVLDDDSILLIDRKTAIFPFTSTTNGPFLPPSTAKALRTKSLAISQNPGFKAVIEVPDSTVQDQVEDVLLDLNITNIKTRIAR